MKEVIGVRFRRNGKVYYFDPRDNEIELGTKVIVETSKGVEYGWVVIPRTEVEENRIQGGLRPIQRLATPQDIERHERNEERAKTAFDVCEKKIRERGLPMKLISSEYSFDNNKVTFYFTADGRVDFRELVKDLAYALHTRIELRQVGVRDEARICGGIGMCGRELCCHSYLTDFTQVSIKMAKEQGLSLNPTKISGVCGRLMCCLKNEQDTYEYLNSLLPNVGDRVQAYDGVRGEVASVNVLRQRVKIYVTDEEGNKELAEYKVEELSGGHRGRRFDLDDENLDPALSALEASDVVAEEGVTEQVHAGENVHRQRFDRGERREEGEGRRNRNRNRDRDKNPNQEKNGNQEKSRERNNDRSQGRDGGKNRQREDKKEDRKKGNQGNQGNKESAKDFAKDGGKDPSRDRKPFHRKNRPNNRPRESKKPAQ